MNTLKKLNEIISSIEFGINATNGEDAYSFGMRNGMRWCKSLLDGNEPEYETAPEIIRCKDCIKCGFCGDNTNLEIMGFNGFCSRAEKRKG